jgi:hypothetical protein
MAVDFQQTTWHYTPENRTIYNDCCENIKSYLKSDYLNHDIVPVHLLKSKLYSIPSAKLEDLTKIYPFSDGSALQYRNNLIIKMILVWKPNDTSLVSHIKGRFLL